MKKLKCLYLIQASGKLPEIYGCLRERDFILLSYKEDTEDTDIFYPNSTWTTGRNKLIEHARSLEEEYDYYICLDEDIVFEGKDSSINGRTTALSALNNIMGEALQAGESNNEEGFNTIENLLLEYAPFIATPYWWVYGHYNDNSLGTKAQSTTMWDACFTCFSKAAFMDNKLLPYVDIFDSKSWWDSQLILIRLCKFYYNNQVVLFNDVKIHNIQRSDYPKRDAYVDFHKAFRESKLDTYEYVSSQLVANKEIDRSDIVSKLGKVDDISLQTDLIEVKPPKKHHKKP